MFHVEHNYGLTTLARLLKKYVWFFALGVILTSLPGFGETWYVRNDGGTRYSANTHKGQCDGKADTAYRGKGSNQHCAFKDYRYLWDDQSYGNDAWVIAGGDTVIVHGGPWRVGIEKADGGYTWCLGGQGNSACQNPKIPSGTSAQHTRILGENHASCANGNVMDRSKLTQVFGGFGVWNALNLAGAEYVDVQCLEITSHSQCSIHGSPALPKGCNTSYPHEDDYDSSGISTDVNTRNILLQDLWIHGHTDRGVKGPIGGTVTANRVDIGYNGAAGWDFDGGEGRASVNGVWNFNYSTIEFSGCNQVYPGTRAAYCYDQDSGGYGDGVGTPAGMCLTVNIDHSVFRYNTQDGLDLGHIDTGRCSLKITNSMAYGNSGAGFKWGPNENPAVATNNIVLGNCNRMSAPMSGQPNTYNMHLSNFCRAGDTWPFNFRQGGRALLANNTIVTYMPGVFDIDCWDDSCSNSTLTFQNNIVFGYDNPRTYRFGAKPGGPGGFYFQKPIGHVVRSSNIYYGVRDIHCFLLTSGEKCADPRFAVEPRLWSEPDLDRFNFQLSSSSAARGYGAVLPGVQVNADAPAN